MCCGIWEEPWFVTLTAKAVPAYRLDWMVRAMLRAMLRAIHLIVSKYRQRQQRGKGKQLTGIRVMESNFNVQKRTYNIHFHILVPNEEVAEILRNEWIALWNRENIKDKKYVNPAGQDKRKVRNRVRGLIEVLKYSTKIFTPEDVRKKRLGKKTPHRVYAKALYNIIRAFKGWQLFDTFGDCRVGPDSKARKQTVLAQAEKLEYDSKRHDWVNPASDKPLSGLLPDPNISQLLDSIDLDSE
jgi:hypothetical protein